MLFYLTQKLSAMTLAFTLIVLSQAAAQSPTISATPFSGSFDDTILFGTPLALTGQPFQ